jgi:protein gp37
MRAEWAQSLRDQCARAGVPFFFKQWGAWVPYSQMPSGVFVHEVRPHLPVRSEDDPLTFMRVGKKAAGRKLDGRFHDDYPNSGHRG